MYKEFSNILVYNVIDEFTWILIRYDTYIEITKNSDYRFYSQHIIDATMNIVKTNGLNSHTKHVIRISFTNLK